MQKRQCIPRNYGKGSVVCVCNYTYCDDLDPIEKLPSKTVLILESGKSGNRFNETKLKLASDTELDNELMINSSTIQLKIDRSKKEQKIIGFGGAFTDATGININSLPLHMATNIIKDYFSVNGIEYSVGRIPIGGTDFSTRSYTYDDAKNDFNFIHFALQEEDIYHKIPLLKLAQYFSPHKVKFFASPWSPPDWVKTNNNTIHGGTIIGQVGGKYWQYWAQYFVKFLKAYESHGVNFWGITVENEPGQGLLDRNPLNCLGLTPESERDFTKLNLGPTLAKAGYGSDKLKIMIHDDNIGGVEGRVNKILSDKEAAKYVSGIGIHWYGNLYGIAPKTLDKVHNKFPNYFILNTESSIMATRKNGLLSFGNWTDGERYAYDIIMDLNHHTSGWVDWNLALSPQAKPSWVNTDCNSPILVNKTGLEYYKQPMFYAMGHFSKFLPPESVKISLTKSSNLTGFEAIAFQRPDKGTVVIVLNKNNYSISLLFDDNSFKLHKELPANSIQSYIW